MSAAPPLVDHLVWIVPDLDAARAQLREEHSVDAVVGGTHPAHGTRNALVRIGPSSYLEILAVDPDADPTERSPRGTMVASAVAPTLHEVVLHVADFHALVDRGASARDAVVTGVFDGARARPDGSRVEWLRAELRTAAGRRLPDVVHWKTPHPSHELPSHCALETVELTTDGPGDIVPALAALGDADGLSVALGPPALTAVIRTPTGMLELTSTPAVI